MTEDEMVGWTHRPNGHEFEQAPGFWSPDANSQLIRKDPNVGKD